MHYQQGDVLVKRIDAIPAKAKRVAHKPLMLGEGHHLHTMTPTYEEDYELYEVDGTLYMRVNVPTKLSHLNVDGTDGEHRACDIDPGDYEIGQVHEWDAWENDVRRVVD